MGRDACACAACRTLANTLRSWVDSGLLSLVYERVAILNDPMPQELAVALDYGFNVLEPRDIASEVKVRDRITLLSIGHILAHPHRVLLLIH